MKIKLPEDYFNIYDSKALKYKIKLLVNGSESFQDANGITKSYSSYLINYNYSVKRSFGSSILNLNLLNPDNIFSDPNSSNLLKIGDEISLIEIVITPTTTVEFKKFKGIVKQIGVSKSGGSNIISITVADLLIKLQNTDIDAFIESDNKKSYRPIGGALCYPSRITERFSDDSGINSITLKNTPLLFKVIKDENGNVLYNSIVIEADGNLFSNKDEITRDDNYDFIGDLIDQSENVVGQINYSNGTITFTDSYQDIIVSYAYGVGLPFNAFAFDFIDEDGEIAKNIAVYPPVEIIFRGWVAGGYETKNLSQGFDINNQQGQIVFKSPIQVSSVSTSDYANIYAKFDYYKAGLWIDDIILEILKMKDGFGNNLFSVENYVASYTEITGFSQDELRQDVNDSKIWWSSFNNWYYTQEDGIIRDSDGTASIIADKLSNEFWNVVKKTDSYTIMDIDFNTLILNEELPSDIEAGMLLRCESNDFVIKKVVKNKVFINRTTEFSEDIIGNSCFIQYINAKTGKFILTEDLVSPQYMQDYSFYTIQSTGIEIPFIFFDAKKIKTRIDAINELRKLVAPNYLIYAKYDKIWGRYFYQKEVEDYELKLETNLQYMGEQDIYTRVKLYATNPKPKDLINARTPKIVDIGSFTAYGQDIEFWIAGLKQDDPSFIKLIPSRTDIEAIIPIPELPIIKINGSSLRIVKGETEELSLSNWVSIDNFAIYKPSNSDAYQGFVFPLGIDFTKPHKIVNGYNDMLWGYWKDETPIDPLAKTSPGDSRFRYDLEKGKILWIEPKLDSVGFYQSIAKQKPNLIVHLVDSNLIQFDSRDARVIYLKYDKNYFFPDTKIDSYSFSLSTANPNKPQQTREFYLNVSDKIVNKVRIEMNNAVCKLTAEVTFVNGSTQVLIENKSIGHLHKDAIENVRIETENKAFEWGPFDLPIKLFKVTIEEQSRKGWWGFVEHYRVCDTSYIEAYGPSTTVLVDAYYRTAGLNDLTVDYMFDGRYDTQIQYIFHAEPSNLPLCALQLVENPLEDEPISIDAIDITYGFYTQKLHTKTDLYTFGETLIDFGDVRREVSGIYSLEYSNDGQNWYPISAETTNFEMTSGQTISFEKSALGENFKCKYIRLMIKRINPLEIATSTSEKEIIYVVPIIEFKLWADKQIMAESKVTDSSINKPELYEQYGDVLYKEVLDSQTFFTKEDLQELAESYLKEFIKDNEKVRASVLFSPHLDIGDTVKILDTGELYFIEGISCDGQQHTLELGRYPL